MEVIVGIFVGTVASVVLGVWASRKQAAVPTEDAPLSEAEAEPIVVPLEKRLRDALFDCERQQKQCEGAIDGVCRQLLDLLQEVGRVSHVEVPGKPLFFEYHHPLTGERHYYYERDLSTQLEPAVLEQTRQLAQQYQQHLTTLLTQRSIFEQLAVSHQENLRRLSGVEEQGQQAQKIADHQAKLSELKGEQQTEEKAIYNQLLLREIEEEVDYQEECMRQYIDLSQTYQRPLDQPLDDAYREHLVHLLERLEAEDPSNPA